MKNNDIHFFKKIIYSLLPAIMLYAVIESITTFLYWQGFLQPQSIWIQETASNEPTTSFDPIRGFKLSKTPSRMLYAATDGTIESSGQIRGNNFGFPDRDDFEVKKHNSEYKRFAVLGDSFTAAPFINENWPDKTEDILGAKGNKVQLMNFSVDGGGIANWCSILNALIDKEDFELDGLVLAVWDDDLQRGFEIRDDSISGTDQNGFRKGSVGYIFEIYPSRRPSTLEEAKPYLNIGEDWLVMPTHDLELVMQGKKRLKPTTPRNELYIWSRFKRGINQLLAAEEDSSPAASPYEITDPGQLTEKQIYMMNQIRSFAARRNIPILVVSIPSRHDLINNKNTPSEISLPNI